MSQKIIEQMEWRYAVKKYNSEKKISTKDLTVLKRVLSLVPTSNGLQPYHFLIVEDPTVRLQLKQHSFNQSQITDASHLIVFCAYETLEEAHIDAFMSLNAEVRELTMDSLLPYREHLKRSVLSRDKQQHFHSNEKQCYIALGHLLQSAAMLGIDATPMEGFNAEGYNEVLNLSDKKLKASVVCALGYRSEDDAFQFMKKVRKLDDSIFTEI